MIYAGGQTKSILVTTESTNHRKELPPGGEWKTINGNKVYVIDNKIVAGNKNLVEL